MPPAPLPDSNRAPDGRLREAAETTVGGGTPLQGRLVLVVGASSSGKHDAYFLVRVEGNQEDLSSFVHFGRDPEC